MAVKRALAKDHVQQIAEKRNISFLLVLPDFRAYKTHSFTHRQIHIKKHTDTHRHTHTAAHTQAYI